MITISVTAAHSLGRENYQAWDDIQRVDATLNSPFLRPDFASAVAAVRPDVKVAVLSEHGEPVGFFPFQQRRWGGVGRPVGGSLSGCQGVIARAGLDWTAEGLLRRCGLAAWDFDYLLVGQSQFSAWHEVIDASLYVDVAEGFEAYCAERARAGSERLRKVQRCARKAAREQGALRFEPHTTDCHVLAALLDWKSQHHLRTRTTNVFAFAWTVRLLERILRETQASFGGMLSALYFGDHLAAVQLGLRYGDVMHGWFTTYNPEFAHYSPGLVLLVELLKAAPALGLRRIQLGRGGVDYKSSFANGGTLVAEGSVVGSALGGLVHQGWRRTRSWIKSAPLRGPVRLAGRITRPFRGWLEFR